MSRLFAEDGSVIFTATSIAADHRAASLLGHRHVVLSWYILLTVALTVASVLYWRRIGAGWHGSIAVVDTP